MLPMHYRCLEMMRDGQIDQLTPELIAAAAGQALLRIAELQQDYLHALEFPEKYLERVRQAAAGQDYRNDL